MSKFKIGDRVVVKGWIGDKTYFEGATGIVTGCEYYVTVLFDHDPNRELLVSKQELEVIPAKPELTEAQAAGVAGGLQEHSVGDVYPLAAVMYEHNGERCVTIENLQTGEVAAVDNHVTNWETFEYAYGHIERIDKGASWLKTKGRVMNIGGRWVVAEAVNPVRVTRLHSMLHRGQNTNSSGS